MNSTERWLREKGTDRNAVKARRGPRCRAKNQG